MGLLFPVFLTESLSKGLSSTNLPLLALKNFSLHTCILANFFFAKHSIWNVWQCPEYVCLNNCSIICALTFCYVLHQKHSEFWHIQYWIMFFQVYASIFNQTQHYWGLLLTRKNIYNLIGWEEYNIGHICTVFNICILLLNKKKSTFDFCSRKIEMY